MGGIKSDLFGYDPWFVRNLGVLCSCILKKNITNIDILALKKTKIDISLSKFSHFFISPGHIHKI